MSSNHAQSESDTQILLTGATGYIGGRLSRRLLERGYHLRCIVRDAAKLRARPWANDPNVEIVEASVEDVDQLTEAARDCRAAYYLIHSMIASGPGYRETDRRLARSFAQAMDRAGVERIIYLGGLGEEGENLSKHLTSRREVEHALASTRVPVTTLRAAMIIGSGSASFEILRYLVERLPVMITPRWVQTECQPIAVRHVIEYLCRTIETPQTTGRTLDIGGPDVKSYRDIMRIMAEERGLPKRVIIPVPVLTPRLSSLWISLVTPVGARIARPLAEGLRNRVVCRNDAAERLMPQKLLSIRESIRIALEHVEANDVETAWSDAGVLPGDPDWAGGTTFVDERATEIQASPDRVFREICRVGGGHGYYAADFLWKVRGFMDQLVGGPGLRRGRRNVENVSYGDALDFWRVTAVEPDSRLDLRAEMKLPGEALLGFRIEPMTTEGQANDADAACCRLTQTARFKPKGLLGLLYWYAVLPLHQFVFNGMLNGIRRAAESPRSSPGAHQAP